MVERQSNVASVSSQTELACVCKATSPTPNSRSAHSHQCDRHRRWIYGHVTRKDKRMHVRILDAPSGIAIESTPRADRNGVCNGGLMMITLATLANDTTNTAARILDYTTLKAAPIALTVPPRQNWAAAVDCWYFGSVSHAETASSLLPTAPPTCRLDPLFHPYGSPPHVCVSGRHQHDPPGAAQTVGNAPASIGSFRNWLRVRLG